MKLLKIFSTSLVTGFSGALMPGPVLAITITAVLQVGFIAAVLIILGLSGDSYRLRGKKKYLEGNIHSSEPELEMSDCQVKTD